MVEVNGDLGARLKRCLRKVRAAHDAGPTPIVVLEEVELRVKDTAEDHDEVHRRAVQERGDELVI
jgi:hypothetical protein